MMVGMAVAVTVASIEASTITNKSAAVVQRREPVSIPPTPPEGGAGGGVVFIAVGEEESAKLHLRNFCARKTL